MRLLRTFLFSCLAIIIADVSVVMADNLKPSAEAEAYMAIIFQKRAERAGMAIVPTQTQVDESKTQSTVQQYEQVIAVTAPIQSAVVTGSPQQEVARMAMTAPPSGNEKKYNRFNEWAAVYGHTIGIDSGVNGDWLMAEYIRWREQESGNAGLGVTFKGWAGSGDNWHDARAEIGPNLDYYREIGVMGNYMLLKLRPLYRFGEHKSGFAPGAYLEFDHILGRNDVLIGAFDISYFPDDTYLGFSLMDEHRFNSDWKLQYGINFMEQIGSDESVFGSGPGLTLKFRNQWKIGLSYMFLPASPVLGISVGWEFNSYLQQLDAESREKSVTQEISGETVPMPTGEVEDVQLAKTTGGDAYVTLPAAQNTVGGIKISDKTFEEEKQ